MALAMRKLFCLVLLNLLCGIDVSSQSIHDPRPVPRYVVDLDTSPEQRWTHIVTKYPQLKSGIITYLRTLVPEGFIPLIEEVGDEIMSYIPSPYAQEMIGIAGALNMSRGELLLYNLAYDITAYCTAIVSEDTEGRIWHARNLDYGFSEIMREITIHVDFQRSGKTVYSAVTMSGYVGILTGQRPHAYTVNVDERDQGGWVKNLLVALFDRSVKSVGFHVRDTLENCETFQSAIESLSNTDVVADVYYILGGVKSGEGVVITKARVKVDDVWYMNQTDYRWFILETNYDHWKKPPSSDDRRNPAIASMKKLGRSNISTHNLFLVLSKPPVFNNGTIHSTVMSAGRPDLMQSWVRYPRSGDGSR